MRKDRTPVKKARKSAPVIVAEARLDGLEKRLDGIESLLWKLAIGSIFGLISAVGTLALILVGFHGFH